MAQPSRSEQVAHLKQLTNEMRRTILEMITEAKSGHPGGSLSAIDIIAALFWYRLKHDPKNPGWPDRDRFILSKGHGVPALYVVLAKRGYFDPAQLHTLRQLGSPLQGHPVNRLMPAVEAPTGSLGQGLSVAQGIALAAKVDGKPYTTYCMMGDGEQQEGQVWEAAMSAAKFKLDNLVGIVDANGGQIDGSIQQVMPSEEPLVGKYEAFGWDVREINGHDYNAILDALAWADQRAGKPKMIVARTIKGYGVSFVQDPTKYHGTPLTKEELARAVDELTKAATGHTEADQ